MTRMSRVSAARPAGADQQDDPDFEYEDEQGEGSFTGFGTYSGGLDLGIPDARGAFNPAFNGQTPTPLYDASTAALRNSLQGLAKRARAGDASAAMQYDAFYQTLQDQQNLYAIATGYGLNDRNATGIMTHLNKVAGKDTAGRMSPQFQIDYANYLSSVVKSRNTNVEKLLPGEQMLDDAFNMAFTTALDRASNRNPSAGSMATTLRQNAGVYSGYGLHLKKALAAWEEHNGFRTDSVRAEIMARAAEYAAKCATNPALRSVLYSSPNKIVEAAATNLGYYGARWDPTVSPLDNYDTAVNTLASRIVYTDAETDAVKGLHGIGEDGQASPLFSAIQDALEKHYGRNVARGASSVFADDTSGQLKADLVNNLSMLPSGSARNNPEFAEMINDVANDIIEMSRGGGTVNISQILKRYHNSAFLDLRTEGAYRPKEQDVDLTAMDQFANSVVDRLYAGRSSVRTNGAFLAALSPRMEKVGLEPEYTREGISASIDQMLLADGSAQAFAQANPELYEKIKASMVSYVYNLNNETDDLTVGSPETSKQGLKDRIAVLGLVADLSARDKGLAKLLSAWEGPKSEGAGATRSSQIRGRTDADLRNIYNGLDVILGKWLESEEALGQRTEGKARYDLDYIQGIYEGMRKSMRLDMQAGQVSDSVREAALKGWQEAGVSGIRKYASNKANSAEDIRYAQLLQRTQPTDKPGRVKALADWSDAVLSSVTNPVKTRNATHAIERFVETSCPTVAKNKNLKANIVAMYVPAMMKLQKIAHDRDPDRSIQIEWADPMSYMKGLGDSANTLFQKIAEIDRAMALQNQRILEESRAAAARGTASVQDE